MKNKKGFKHYIRMYLLLLVVYTGMTVVVAAMNSWDFDSQQLVSILYLPIIFVLFLFVFDTIFALIFKPKGKTDSDDDFKSFGRRVTSEMKKKDMFSIEDYRRLQESDRFQKALHHAFEIYENGEKPEMNIVFLEKKFKKDSIEGKAMTIVLDEVKKTI